MIERQIRLKTEENDSGEQRVRRTPASLHFGKKEVDSVRIVNGNPADGGEIALQVTRVPLPPPAVGLVESPISAIPASLKLGPGDSVSLAITGPGMLRLVTTPERIDGGDHTDIHIC